MNRVLVGQHAVGKPSASIWLMPAARKAGWLDRSPSADATGWNELVSNPAGQASGKQFILADIWQVVDALKVVFALWLPASR